MSTYWYCIKSWCKARLTPEMKPYGRKDWEMAKMLSTSLLPLPSSHSGKLLQSLLPCYNYLTLNHICSRLSQASTLTNPAAESTYSSCRQEWNCTSSTLPTINWAAKQSCPERKKPLCFCSSHSVFSIWKDCIYSLWKGYFWRDVSFWVCYSSNVGTQEKLYQNHFSYCCTVHIARTWQLQD